MRWKSGPILLKLKEAAQFLKEVCVAWANTNTSRLGAALAYYTLFAFAPLFLIAIYVASVILGKEEARREVMKKVYSLFGQQGGQAIQSMLAAASRPRVGTWATIGAVVTLLLGATAVFVELQSALNTIWGVKLKPGGGGFLKFITDRLLSFAMVLGVGFLLLVSLILNAVLSALGKFASGMLPNQHLLWSILNFVVSLGIVTVLFAMILKVLPDVTISWREVWIGAFVTAVLFDIGKYLIGLYLGRSTTTSIYGAAGSFVILLLWVYYSAQIVFFGAEFTHIYSEKFKDKSRPA